MMRGWRKLRRSQVIVNLDTGRAFEGVLYRVAGTLLVLAHARSLEPGHDATPVAGEVVVDRSRVEFVQVIEPGTPP